MGLFSRRKSDAKNYGQNVMKAFQAQNWKEVERLTTEAAEKYPDDANVLYVTAYMACDFNEMPVSAIKEALLKADSFTPRDPSVTPSLSLSAKVAYLQRKSREFYLKNVDTEEIPGYCEDLSLRIRDSYMAMSMGSANEATKARHMQNVANAIRNCPSHPATWLGVSLMCPFEDSFDEYDMEIANTFGVYQSGETSMTMGDVMLYMSHSDPTKQLIGHSSNDLLMYQNRDEFAQKLRDALGDEFFKD